MVGNGRSVKLKIDVAATHHQESPSLCYLLQTLQKTHEQQRCKNMLRMRTDEVLAFHNNSMIGNLKEWKLFFFFQRLQENTIRRDKEDRLVQMDSKCDKVSVKSFSSSFGTRKKKASPCEHSTEPLGPNDGEFLCKGNNLGQDFHATSA